MLHVLVLLHSGPGGTEALRAYERRVMPILRAHGATLRSAFAPRERDAETVPDEVHLLEFPSESAFSAYREDPRHLDLAEDRRRAIAKTTLLLSDVVYERE